MCFCSDEADDQTQVQPNNSVSVSENLSREKMSLSPANIADTPAMGTPHSNSVYHISTAESANDMQNNSSCSPNVQSGEKKIVCDSIVKEEEKIETGVCQGHKVVNTDVQSTRESFEDALSSLVRTKESIGRATRLAMDLMKFCVPAKVEFCSFSVFFYYLFVSATSYVDVQPFQFPNLTSSLLIYC